MNRIKRAKAQNSIMTVIFYAIAVFFFVLLAAFAGYVLLKALSVQIYLCSDLREEEA